MKYVAVYVVTVPVGHLVRLSADQLARCEGMVKPAADADGWHEALVPLQFKRGETFEIDGELPKGMADLAEAAEPPRPRRQRQQHPPADQSSLVDADEKA
jgi:hypothetical protein